MSKKLLVVLCLALPIAAQATAPPVKPWTSSIGARKVANSGRKTRKKRLRRKQIAHTLRRPVTTGQIAKGESINQWQQAR
ncbi:MAG TPA: hypothetical protein VNA69_08250 [Thermoanaerobaculia bacterium]|nr:hypothetical protein [Thermoanaerobaculia bacterium]